MTGPRSLRTRVLLGSILWTLGLLGVTHLLSMLVIRRFRHVNLVIRGHTFLLVALIFMGIGLLFLRSGVSPFRQLRERLTAVRDGHSQRVDGTYPSEVQPLVNDLNDLLEHRERVVSRALAKAGDLAHGLKTPLALIAHEAGRAEAAGNHELAATIGQQVERMRRQIDYHLAHARAAASGPTPGTRCTVIESAEGLARTLLRLHADRGLAIDLDVSPAHAVRVEREDLDEMLGNLLDNACRWARARVTVASSEEGSDIIITVDDDGPGLDASMTEAVLQRGVRADEAGPGSGLGLAIVRDLAELYSGTISLTTTPGGSGLRARLRLPGC